MSLLKIIYVSILIVTMVMFRDMTSLVSAGQIAAGEKDVRVAIYNLLPNNADFTIHCKSGDDDLGEHTITAANHYEFSFNVNFLGTTLFFCGVSWQGGQAMFDIYKAKRDQGRCRHYCYWTVKAKGIEGFKESTSIVPDLFFPWGKAEYKLIDHSIWSKRL